jgi:hypothetical protein
MKVLTTDIKVSAPCSILPPSFQQQHSFSFQIEACNNEAIRLETMISIQHPRIQADLVLSTVLGARTTTANITGAKSSSPGLFLHLFIVFISVIYSCFVCRLNLVLV